LPVLISIDFYLFFPYSASRRESLPLGELPLTANWQ